MSPADTGQASKATSMFSKIQRVFIKGRDREERQRDLRIDLDLLSGIGPLGRQLLSLQLSDDEDPYFLFSLSLTAEDFKVLRMEQGLLVDFDSFANQVVRLLEECSSSARVGLSNRFSLVLSEDGGSTRLEFMETNEFKHLCHLALRVVEGMDGDVKKHMSTKIKVLKESLSNATSMLEQKQNMLSVAYDKLEAKDQELECLRQKLSREKDDLEHRVMQEAAEAREALTRAHMEWQGKLERERQECEASKIQELTLLEEQLSEIKLRNTLLSEKLMNTENNVRDLAKLADSTQKELKVVQKEASNLRRQNSQIDMDYHKKEESVNLMKTKLAVVEQELKSKNSLLEQQQEVLHLTTERKNELEAKIVNMEESVGTKRASLQQLQSEVVKANEIISKQLNEIQILSGKVKLRTEVALKQESLLNAREKELDELKRLMSGAQSNANQCEDAINKIKDELNKAKEAMQAKDLIIKNNEQVVNYLTKQIKEADSRVIKSVLPTSLMSGPASSTPMSAGGLPNGLFGTSSIQPFETSAEHFLMRQKENIRSQAELRQKLGLTEPIGSYRPMEKSLTPLLEQSNEAKSISVASGDSKKPNRPVVKSRHTPTITTPAVKRSDILSAYFPKST